MKLIQSIINKVKFVISLKLFGFSPIIILLLFSCTKNPTDTGNDKKEGGILFIRRNSREFSEICTMKPDGSDVQVIAHHDSNEYIKQFYRLARWSPDKSKIVAEGGPEQTLEYSPIWIMSNAGKLLYKLTSNGGMAVWSPGGETIIFSRRKAYFSLINDLYIINSSGQNESIFVETENRSRFATDWSKDGAKILITETYTYYDSLGRLDTDSPEIGILDTTTKEIEYLTKNEVQDYFPRWSPDGTKIVFVSGLYKSADIFIYDSRDKTIRNLTEDPNSYQYPIWSPDGSKIIYSKPLNSHNMDIYLLDLENMEVMNLTSSFQDSIRNLAVDWK